jgi:hypothetical protein
VLIKYKSAFKAKFKGGVAMKKFRFERKPVMFIFLLILIAGTSCTDVAKKRSAIKAEWLKCTREVTNKINDKEATEIFQFLDKNLILAEPCAEGIKFIEGSKSTSWLAIVPLQAGDDKFSEQWQEAFTKNAIAYFVNQIRAIIIKSHVAFSPAGKAIIFLHEGYHGCAFIEQPYEQQDEKEFCYEEVRAHTFQNKVMSLMGGKRYQEILDREVERISADTTKSGNEISLPNRTDYNQDLAAIFGEPASGLEKDYIQTSIWIHAIFVFLDERHKGKAEDLKAIFLRSLYKDMEIFE